MSEDLPRINVLSLRKIPAGECRPGNVKFDKKNRESLKMILIPARRPYAPVGICDRGRIAFGGRCRLPEFVIFVNGLLSFGEYSPCSIYGI